MSDLDAPRAILAPGERIPRHRHRKPYATVVLRGGYDEAGDGTRWRVEAGEVLLHGPFASHCDLAASSGAQVLNLPLPFTGELCTACRVSDPDRLVRLAETNLQAAAEALLFDLRPGPAPLTQAPDRLASLLVGPASPGVARWSSANGVSRQTAFRWFRNAYGVGPARFRVEARARRAWRMIVETRADLAEIADLAGFADQAHMSRAVRALTGCSPAHWRRTELQPSFKTTSR